MRKINFVVACLFLFGFNSLSFGQETQTLIDGEVSHGGFGGPVLKMGDIAGETGLWVGGRGGWIITIDEQNALSLGGGGYGLVTEHDLLDPNFGDTETDYRIMDGYGGFELEYTNRSHRLVHLSLSSLVGGGALMVRDADFDDVMDDHDPYFVLEPAANIELNVTDFMRAAAGVGYRYTSGINSAGFEDADFSGVTGTFALKFGKF